MPGNSVYASSKAAVDHITRNLAVEYGASGVRINAIAPGFTTTDMSNDFVSDNEGMLEAIISQTPMGRAGKPTDIAKAVRLIATEDAGWITGQIIQVSGGLML